MGWAGGGGGRRWRCRVDRHRRSGRAPVRCSDDTCRRRIVALMSLEERVPVGAWGSSVGPGLAYRTSIPADMTVYALSS